MTELFTTRTTHFSPCRRYRYQLRIVWDDTLPLLCCIGLNPSTADETKDDPTLRRVQGFARDMGRGGVLMLNAYGYRSTDPKVLLSISDPCGPENTPANLRQWIEETGTTAIAAWGANIGHDWQVILKYELSNLDCFRITKSGYPEHPLYLPASLRPVAWNY